MRPTLLGHSGIVKVPDSPGQSGNGSIARQSWRDSKKEVSLRHSGDPSPDSFRHSGAIPTVPALSGSPGLSQDSRCYGLERAYLPLGGWEIEITPVNGMGYYSVHLVQFHRLGYYLQT